MLTGWFLLGTLAQASLLGMLQGEVWLVAFLFATSFFLVYVPFSKISHYPYYPITRWYIGKALGHRGSYIPCQAAGKEQGLLGWMRRFT